VSLQALLQGALQAHQAGDLQRAQDLVDQVLSAVPNNAHGLHIAGLIARDMGFDVQAERLMKSSLQDELSGRTKAEFSNNLARFYKGQGLLDLALQVATSGTQSDPTFKPVRRLRSQILSQVGLYQDAIKEAELLTRQSAIASDWLTLANAHRSALDWDETKKAAEAMLAIAPENRLGQHVLAIAVGHLSPFSVAETYFQPLADDGDAMCSLANAYLEAGQIERAAATFTKAMALDPFSARILSSQAEFLWMIGQKDIALLALQAACEAKPDSPILYRTLASIAQKLGQLHIAQAAIERALLVSPGHPSVLLQQASLFCEAGLLAQATQLARTAIKAWPNNEVVLREGAAIMLRTGDFDTALQLCQLGCQMRPWGYEWIALRASTQRALGQLEYRYWFNFDDFVKSTPIDIPTGFASIEAFNLALGQWLRDQHVLQEHPLVNSVRRGSQISLPVQKGRAPLLDAFQDAITGPINRYIEALKSHKNHPFAQRSSNGWRLSGLWSVRLREGGSHVNHIHPDGWLSSAYYVDIPDSFASKTNHEGWIGFGSPRFPAPNMEHEVWIEPKPGQLALFPSYLWHGVKPFSETSERLTIAFDVVPL
jgi:uncharacterized protein (TIGR02466 family)